MKTLRSIPPRIARLRAGLAVDAPLPISKAHPKTQRVDAEYTSEGVFFGAGPGNNWLHAVGETVPAIVVPVAALCKTAEDHMFRGGSHASLIVCTKCGSWSQEGFANGHWNRPAILRASRVK